MDKKEELLNKILDNINYWLAFAEAKNAGLLAFNIAVLAVIFSIEDMNVLLYILVVLVLFSTLCVFAALWSRFVAKWKTKDEPNENDNLLYYRDIAKYSEKDFILKFYKKYYGENLTNVDSVPLYIKNLVSHIVINAKIASRKFILFNMALKINILVIVLAIIMAIIA